MTRPSLERRTRLLEAAEGYLTLGMAEHALRELGILDDCDSCVVEVNQLRAEAYRQQQRYDDALGAYSVALTHQPDNAELLLGMAWCYKRLDQLEHAISATRQAYRANPGMAVTLYNLACYYALAGRKDQALSWLGRSLRMDSRLRHLIPFEHDFDRLRNDPDFQFVAGLSKTSHQT